MEKQKSKPSHSFKSKLLFQHSADPNEILATDVPPQDLINLGKRPRKESMRKKDRVPLPRTRFGEHSKFEPIREKYLKEDRTKISHMYPSNKSFQEIRLKSWPNTRNKNNPKITQK